MWRVQGIVKNIHAFPLGLAYLEETRLTMNSCCVLSPAGQIGTMNAYFIALAAFWDEYPRFHTS